MENENFEEIKKKYKKSNKYVLYLTYEDIGILIHLVNEEKEKNKELKTIIEAYNIISNEYFKDGFIKENMIPKSKIKAKIEDLEKEQEDNRKDLYNAVNNLNFSKIDIISDRIFVNMSIKDILQSLLEKE